MSELLVLDVGNTRVTAARVVDAVIAARASFVHDGDLAGLAHFAQALPAQAAVALVSVNDAAAARVLAALGARRALVAPRDFRATIANACRPPESVGQDRLFNAAALDCGPVVIVDAGTAITVDFVDGERVFQGGAIAPGVGLSFRALHERTGRLPLIAPDPARAVPARGTNTADALRCGVVRGLAGLVDRLIDEVAGAPAPVVMTGGDAALLAPHLRHVATLDADLMLRGIARSVLPALGAMREVAR